MITFRPFQNLDKPQILILMDEFQKYIESIDDLKRTKYRPEAAEFFTNQMIKRAQEKDGIIYIAQDENQIIGFIGGHIETQDEEEQMETIPAKPGIISEFFVSKLYRERGIGKQLLSQAEDYLKSKGCTIARLCVFAPNDIARQFYAKNGFGERLIWAMKEIT